MWALVTIGLVVLVAWIAIRLLRMRERRDEDALDDASERLIQRFMKESRQDPWIAWRASAMYRVEGVYADIVAARLPSRPGEVSGRARS